MELLQYFLQQCLNNGYSINKTEKNEIVIAPDIIEQHYIPNLIIKDPQEFEKTLEEYIKTICNSSLRFYQIDVNHKIDNYLFYLIKSLTNEDSQDLNVYTKRFIEYLKDESFNELFHSKIIGKVDCYDVLARKCEEFYGSETPFTLRLYLEKIGFKFEMPLIRYAILEDNKAAYIYSVQRKRIYNNKHPRIKSVNTMLNAVNSGVKENRDITPSMICSLAIFIGLLKSQGINNIKVDGFLTRRYGYLNGITNEEDKDKVFHNSVDKFIKLFIRLSSQFDGVEINAYPFDVDSYLHITLEANITSENKLLEELFNIGKNYQEYIGSENLLVRKKEE